MKFVILAGGLGTRLVEETEVRPKPMVEIGGQPIVWHIMKGAEVFGFNEFVLALGYKGEIIKDYFINYHLLRNSITVGLAAGTVKAHRPQHEDWQVHLVDTGLDTNTGGRIRRLKQELGNETFMVTYGDGVSDVDLGAVLALHRRQRRICTLTAVRPPARFGALHLEDDRVVGFAEKPLSGEGWINGGFMVFEPEVFDYLRDDQDSLEVTALERLAAENQLAAYRHDGFWQCMDTLRDKRLLESLWSSGRAPWRRWS